MSSKPGQQIISQDEKEKKAAEKAKRKAEFEAKRAAELKKKETEADGSASLGDANQSKADLKKQRREQQEAQRAAKAKDDEKKNAKSQPKQEETKENQQPHQPLPKPIIKPISIKDIQTKPVETVVNRPEEDVQVFPEIPKRHADITALTKSLGFKGEVYHPAVVQLGVKLNQGMIKGSTPRLLALMVATRQLIQDYSTPSGKALDRDLPASLDSCMDFLAKCRPLTTGMMNAGGFIKRNISRISRITMEGSPCHRKPNESEVKTQLIRVIDDFIQDEIVCALQSIIEEAASLISDGDVIMTLGCSLKMQHVLLRALKSGKKFSVIVVDSGPDYDGVQMLRFLKDSSQGDQLRMTYIYISAVAHVMNTVSKVIVGGHGVLANGYVMSKMGTSQVALVANSYNVPFIVCCETNEFADAVHTDAFVYNESGLCQDYFRVKNEKLGKFVKETCNLSSNVSEKKRKNIKILNLLFDVTPPDYVCMIVTEKGIIPCSAVSAVIRRNFSKIQ